jgi:transcriptional regulator with XRE-family HTH domain
MYVRIRELRNDNDKTREELAAYLKLSLSGYGKYENGSRDIPTAVLSAIAIYYNTSTDYILGLTDDIKPYKRK